MNACQHSKSVCAILNSMNLPETLIAINDEDIEFASIYGLDIFQLDAIFDDITANHTNVQDLNESRDDCIGSHII